MGTDTVLEFLLGCMSVSSKLKSAAWDGSLVSMDILGFLFNNKNQEKPNKNSFK